MKIRTMRRTADGSWFLRLDFDITDRAMLVRRRYKGVAIITRKDFINLIYETLSFWPGALNLTASRLLIEGFDSLELREKEIPRSDTPSVCIFLKEGSAFASNKSGFTALFPLNFFLESALLEFSRKPYLELGAFDNPEIFRSRLVKTLEVIKERWGPDP